MSIQEFAAQLEEREHPSALLEALRALRDGDLEGLRVAGGDCGCEWPRWPPNQEGLDQAPKLT